MTLLSTEESLLRRHLKAICHLNFAVKRDGQLGFILGAGVSRGLKIPDWYALLEAMEANLAYKPSGKDGPQSYRGEQLFQFYRKKRIAEFVIADREVRDAAINTGWRRMVSKHLYREYIKADGKVDLAAFQAAIEGHAYLRELARIAIDLELVITHNFDNALEMAVAATPSSKAANRRSNSFWKPDPFLRPEMLNIYHPNGYTPTEGVKGSDSIVLTEANFADHLANTNNAEANFLLGHLSNKTWLLIGHSLADGTLKNALRLHASRRPGHISYFVHFVEGGEDDLSVEQRDAIREANFTTYNLYTFFLNAEEISALLRLIHKPAADLKADITSCSLEPRFVYYICGAVSSGKSTILSHLRSIATVEEWPDRMPAAMNKLSVDATPGEKKEIDTNLDDAIWKKNEEINDTKVGLVAVDRAPLDFIAFPDKDGDAPEVTAKNRYEKVLKRFISADFANLCPGQVIFIQTKPETLLERQIQRGRPSSDADLLSGKALDALKYQQDVMCEIYEPAIADKSTARGDCCSIATCVQDVIRIIYFGTHVPFNFKSRLNDFLGSAPK
ncbi:MAG: SIR2 family protein [Alphaproteobacteria bacterium]|nr:SIR2 family protein [Alphaproteobacteria bacterium]